jgi:rhodanese-related sulfurtransferase
MMNHFFRGVFFVLMMSIQACGQTGAPSQAGASTEAASNEAASNEAAPFSALSPAQFAERMNSDSQVVVVDVRTADECQEGVIPGALLVDFYQEEKMKQAMQNWDPSRTYLVYCRSGGRSGQTLDLMKARGFKRVYHLEGGMNAWSRAGSPVTAP